MKYSTTVVINAPRDLVVSYFSDPKYLSKYQEGFVGKELVSGTEGKEGAVSFMRYRMGNRNMEIKETIIDNGLPHRFEGLYEHKHMDNTLTATFKEIDADQTGYTVEINYFRIAWIMPKIFMNLFPEKVKEQSDKWLYNFKAFVESQYQ